MSGIPKPWSATTCLFGRADLADGAGVARELLAERGRQLFRGVDETGAGHAQLSLPGWWTAASWRVHCWAVCHETSGPREVNGGVARRTE